MPHFDIIKESKPSNSFRVASVRGKFDLQDENIRERFIGSIDFDENWQVGLIVGKSGTGKTTIAKQLFPKSYITSFEYCSNTILDDMPKERSVEEISMAFNSVGFSSPPSWLKPYNILSGGEKMRCDLARAILSDMGLFVFDEFTSVVDRQVAQVGSFAIQKAIRKTKNKFIAVSCHFDVEDWLLPDWVFDTDSMTFRACEGQKKNRPEIEFGIFETKEKNYYWGMFGKYHYLSHSHNNAARVFIATVNKVVCGFISVLHFPHPNTNKIKRVHRLIIFPDYQGLGIGIKLLNEIGKIYKKNGFRFTITSSAPSIIFSLKKSEIWKCNHFGRNKSQRGIREDWSSSNRITVSFEMI